MCIIAYDRESAPPGSQTTFALFPDKEWKEIYNRLIKDLAKSPFNHIHICYHGMAFPLYRRPLNQEILCFDERSSLIQSF